MLRKPPIPSTSSARYRLSETLHRRPIISTTPASNVEIKKRKAIEKKKQRRSSKGKEKALDQDYVIDDDDDDEDHSYVPERIAAPGRRNDKGKVKSTRMLRGKKKVRIESSDKETSSDRIRSSSEDDEEEDRGNDADQEEVPVEVGEEEEEEEEDDPKTLSRKKRKNKTKTGTDRLRRGDQWDWIDPSTLPLFGRTVGAAKQRQVNLLEQGIVNSALFDSVKGEFDLMKILFEWEIMRRRRTEADPDTENGQVSRRRRSPSSAAGGKGKEKEHESDEGSEDEDDHEDNDDDDDQDLPTRLEKRIPLDQVPLPTPLFLEKMSRWPLHSSQLDATPFRNAESLSLAIEELLARSLPGSALSRELHQPTSKPKKARNAYRANAPYGVFVEPSTTQVNDKDPESSSSESSEDDLGSSLDDPIEFNPHPQKLHSIIERLETIVDTVTDQLLQRVKLGPAPPVDAWQETQVVIPIKLDRAIGWETVLEIAKGLPDISDSVTNELERRMISIYGPSRPSHPIDTRSTGPPRVVKARQSRAQSEPSPSKRDRRPKRARDSMSSETMGETKIDRLKRMRMDVNGPVTKSLPASRSGTPSRTRLAQAHSSDEEDAEEQEESSEDDDSFDADDLMHGHVGSGAPSSPVSRLARETAEARIKSSSQLNSES